MFGRVVTSSVIGLVLGVLISLAPKTAEANPPN